MPLEASEIIVCKIYEHECCIWILYLTIPVVITRGSHLVLASRGNDQVFGYKSSKLIIDQFSESITLNQLIKQSINLKLLNQSVNPSVNQSNYCIDIFIHTLYMVCIYIALYIWLIDQSVNPSINQSINEESILYIACRCFRVSWRFWEQWRCLWSCGRSLARGSWGYHWEGRQRSVSAVVLCSEGVRVHMVQSAVSGLRASRKQMYELSQVETLNVQL